MQSTASLQNKIWQLCILITDDSVEDKKKAKRLKGYKMCLTDKTSHVGDFSTLK